MFPRQTQTAPPGCNRNTGVFKKKIFSHAWVVSESAALFSFSELCAESLQKVEKKNHARTATSPRFLAKSLRPSVIASLHGYASDVVVIRVGPPAAVETKTIHPLATTTRQSISLLSPRHGGRVVFA